MDGQRARFVAAGAALGSAILYVLVGFGVLDIGTATFGEEVDLKQFGTGAGAAFLAVALVSLLARNKWYIGAAGLFDAAVVLGYFVMAGVREPPVEVWGLSIKALQVIVFIAIVVVVTARPVVEGRHAPRRDVLTARASTS